MASGPRWLPPRPVGVAKPDGRGCSAAERRPGCTVSRVAVEGRRGTHAVILRPLLEFLTDGTVHDRRLRVHLFDTGLSPPMLLAHTCSDALCTADTRSFRAPRPAVIPPTIWPVASPPIYAPQPTAYAVQPPSPYGYPPAPTILVTVLPHPLPGYPTQALQAGTVGLRTDVADPSAVAAFQAQMAQAAYTQQIATRPVRRRVQGPVYVSSPMGTYVNVGRGAVETEVRGVFVSNIDYGAGTKELERFFGRAGEIVCCRLQRNPVTGKSKGNATVQYATADEARNAVRLFNDEKHMSMRLRVRLDRGAIATGVPMPSASSSRSDGTASTTRPARRSRDGTEPVIVDGSVCQR
jgi:hypothetical protein